MVLEREREREKESFKMSVFKRLLYHNGFPCYPNSDVLDLKQKACAPSSGLTSMLYIFTFGLIHKLNSDEQ